MITDQELDELIRIYEPRTEFSIILPEFDALMELKNYRNIQASRQGLERQHQGCEAPESVVGKLVDSISSSLDEQAAKEEQRRILNSAGDTPRIRSLTGLLHPR